MSVAALRRGTLAASRVQSSPSTPPVFRHVTSNFTLDSSISVNIPVEMLDGDLMLATVSVQVAGRTLDTPGGWTLVQQADDLATFRRFKQSGDTAVTFAVTGALSTRLIAIIAAYSGVNTSTPVDISGSQASGTSGTITAPDVTTTVANTKVVRNFYQRMSSNIATDLAAPATMRVEVDGVPLTNTRSNLAWSDADQSAAGATGTLDCGGQNGSAATKARTVALRPA